MNLCTPSEICVNTNILFDTKYFFPKRIHTFVRETVCKSQPLTSLTTSHLPAEAFLPAEVLT